MRPLLFLLCIPAIAQVPYQRIAASAKEPGNWLTYSGNYQGHRYSPLAQITPANVAGLHVKWAYQFPDRRTEVSPIVVDGVMYVTGPNTAAALDVRTGRELWTWRRPHPERLSVHRLRSRESRRGRARRPGLCRHARLLPRRARREERRRAVVHQGRGLQARLQPDPRAARDSTAKS